MGLNGSALDFNKELLFGEVGSLIFSPLAAYIVSKFTSVQSTISISAIFGAIFGASLFWTLMRVYDRTKHGRYNIGKLAGDIAYFTPVAFLFTVLIYYPSIFIGSRYFLNHGDKVVYSVVFSQVLGFLIFMLSMNVYRYVLHTYFRKDL